MPSIKLDALTVRLPLRSRRAKSARWRGAAIFTTRAAASTRTAPRTLHDKGYSAIS
jgi:hypothetical protein